MPVNTFSARYPGTCYECGGRFSKGDEIARVGEHDYVHGNSDECESRDPIAVPEGTSVCPKCSMHHEGECL